MTTWPNALHPRAHAPTKQQFFRTIIVQFQRMLSPHFPRLRKHTATKSATSQLQNRRSETKVPRELLSNFIIRHHHSLDTDVIEGLTIITGWDPKSCQNKPSCHSGTASTLLHPCSQSSRTYRREDVTIANDTTNGRDLKTSHSDSICSAYQPALQKQYTFKLEFSQFAILRMPYMPTITSHSSFAHTSEPVGDPQ